MTTTSSPTLSQDDIIIQKLRQKEIKAIALIDDAYDPLDTQEVSDEQISTFWKTVSNKRDTDSMRMRSELDDFARRKMDGNIIKAKKDIDNDVLMRLWEERTTFDALQEPLEQLFSTKIGKQEQLERICSRLKDRCTAGGKSLVEIKTLGGKEDIVPKIEGAAIVFIDYHMGADVVQDLDKPSSKKAQEIIEQSIKRAKEIAMAIYAHYAKDKLPLVILMSSSPSIAIKSHQERFRRDSGWLNGLFYCIPKEDLEDEEKVGINLGTWIERLEEGSKIQQFINTVDDSLHKAVIEFINSVKDLSLEDYAYVQSFSLDADGQPLGEYILWLFSSYLGRLAFENNKDVNEQQEIIDKLSFRQLPLNQLMPSPELIEMYDSALFNKHVGDISKHPSSIQPKIEKGKKKSSEDKSLALPYLRLGQLFVKEDASEVRMVINADCDLAYAPQGGRSAVTVVALIAGELHEIKSYALPLKEPKTEFFKFRGSAYNISWQVNKIEFYRYVEVLRDLETQGFQPYAALRLPFALEVQRAYAAHFARIGMPVAPPIFHEVKVEILHRNADNNVISILAPQQDLAFLMTIKKKDGSEGEKQLRCRFTTHFGHNLKRALTTLRDDYRDVAAKVEVTDKASGNLKKQLDSKADRLDKMLNGFDGWFLINHSPDLSGQTKPVSLYKELVGVHRNLDKKEFQEWGNYQLIVNLIDPTREENNGEVSEGDK